MLSIRSLHKIQFELEKKNIQVDDAIVLYCFKGARLSNSYIALRKLGYKNIRIYFAGWNEWCRKENAPIISEVESIDDPILRENVLLKNKLDKLTIAYNATTDFPKYNTEPIFSFNRDGNLYFENNPKKEKLPNIKKFTDIFKGTNSVDIFNMIDNRETRTATIIQNNKYYHLNCIGSRDSNQILVYAFDNTKLHNLSERMELALLGNNDGLWDWNLIDNTLYLSPRWKEMLGYSDEELTNEFSTLKNNIHLDDLESTLSNAQKNIDGKTDYYEHTLRLKHKNGHWVWIHARGKTYFNEDSQAIRMIGTHTDISTEKALALKYALQAKIIEQIHDSVITTDLKGYLTNWNHGSEVLLEYKPNEVIGKHITMLYPEEDFESLSQNIEILKRDGENNVTARLVKKSKEIIDVELSLSLLRNEEGEPIAMVGYSQDITKRKKAEKELAQQHKYLQSIIDGVDDPIMVIKEDYTVEIMNKSLKKSLDYIDIADPKHPKCYEVSHHRSTPCDGLEHPCPLREVLETKEHTAVVHNHYTSEGKSRYVELSASPLLDGENKCIGIIESARDITEHLNVQDELREQKSILAHQAHHDALTGLPNRVLFNDRLEQAIETAKRYKTNIALFFIDLDHFKEINDSLGHDVGDEILKTVSNRLNAVVRDEDTVARLGGDEFTVILEDLSQAQDSSLIANKILESLAKEIVVKDNTLYVSTSIGISIYPNDGISSVDLLKFADSAMYKAKDEGRNNFQYYNSIMTELAFERVVMETSLRAALKNEEFVVYYQPQINGAKDHLIGMEALVRWKHPTMGLVPPNKFIPLAESTGLIVELDRLVMKIAMAQLSLWYKNGLNPGVLAMNLAVKQLKKEDFIETVQNLMKETECKAEWIEFELAEGQIMTNPEEAIKTLQKISDMGIELAVDDFGTGYSSLAYLKRLPINTLKIDQIFIKDLPDDEEDIGITKAVIALAHSLNLKVIAEGVETKEQRDFVVENGCDNIQGYYYSKPIPAKELESYLLNKLR